MIRKLQRERLIEIFSIPGWKVLILDSRTQEILSPLIRTSKLRDLGITSIFKIENIRHKITNSISIYFVRPTKKNIDIIINDLENDKYNSFNLHFLTRIDRKQLEYLATEAAKLRKGLFVDCVYDEFVDFVCLSDDLFITGCDDSVRINCIIDEVLKEGIRSSFRQKDNNHFNLKSNTIMSNVESNTTTSNVENNSIMSNVESNNNKNTSKINIEVKEMIENYKKKVLNSLLSIFFLLKEIPFIEDNPFGRMVNDYLNKMNIIKKGYKRPLLVIFDRKNDMITPIEHVWSYNALINEFFEFNLGRVKICKESNNKSPITYDIDLDDDFWIENQNESIPVVAERIEKLFVEHKKYMALRNITDRSSQKDISKVLESAPELAHKNELVNTHMKICLEIINIVSEKKIDEMYKMEKERKYEDISGDKEEILRLRTVLNVDDESNFTLDDKEFIIKIRKFHPPPVIKSKIYTHVTTILGNLKKFLPASTITPLSQFVENCYRNAVRSEFINGECHDISQISKIIVYSRGGGSYTEYKSLKELEVKLNIPIIYGCDQILNWRAFKEQVDKM
ncbi:SEC1 family transport protein SLY1 [Dictyocoela muelleri]|nr:SEC1 family transport protein SLY1 [Dictyocoela muelleri]